MNNSETWKILEGILELHTPDVVAHNASCELPTDDMRLALKRFAKGEIDSNERAELCAQLKENPNWVTYLADCVRELRTA